MPGPYTSAWSRLVDLPYALIASMLRPAFGLERALAIALLVWPATMAILFCIAVAGVLGHLAPRLDELPPRILIVTLFLMVHAIWEFTLGRIDHHNVQMLLLLALIYGIARFDIRNSWQVPMQPWTI